MRTYALTNPLMHGDDLKDLQRALQRAKLYHGPIDGKFGSGSGHACYAAKWRLGYPKAAVRATGGQTLLDYLRGTRKLPLAYRARRRARGYGLSKAARLRLTIVELAMWGSAHRGEIHYRQARPMDKLRDVRGLPWWTDCSEFITTIYKWAGGPDPNGLNFNGQGWTGTMLNHGWTIPLWQAKPGDCVIWGYAPGHHTAIIVDMSNPGDPMIVSHGQEAGPLHLRLSAENAAQRRPHVVKRYIRD